MGLIHGDLSAYNILYWEGAITLIDFPQDRQPQQPAVARDPARRDVTRLCEYFQRQGVSSDPARLADDLWARDQNLKPSDWLDDLPEDFEDGR